MATKKPRSPVSDTFISEVMEITPAVAKEWLATNHNNRWPSAAHQKKLEADMRAGRWVVNGEAIKFDENGNLLDGQHRLRAVVGSGVTIQSLVVMGVPATSFNTMDTGRVRKLADVLVIAGNKTAPSKLAAGIRMAMLIERGNVELAESIPHSETMAWFADNPHIAQFASAPKVTRALLPSAVYVGFKYKIWQRHPVMAMDFFEKFETGADLSANHPVKVLRDRLLVQKSKLGDLRTHEKLALTIKAWNLFLVGKTIVNLRWTKGDEFPEIK